MTALSFIYASLFFMGLLSLTGAGILLLLFKHERPSYVSYWAGGCLFTAIGVFLLSAKGVVPDWLSYRLGNGFTFTALILFNFAIANLAGKFTPPKAVALKSFFGMLLLVITLFVTGNYYDPSLQPAIYALFSAAVSFYGFFLVLEYQKIANSNFSKTLGIAQLAMGAFWSIRFFSVVLLNVGFVFDGGLINSVSYGFLLFLGLIKFMCFVGLVVSIEQNKKSTLMTENHAMKVALVDKRLEETESQFLASLNALAKARDNETGNHIVRTQHYVKALALRLRSFGHYVDHLSDESIHLLFKAAPLHDIGKVGIPDNILLKNGALTDEEWAVMKTHTLIGESILNAAGIEQDCHSEVIAKAIKIAGGHHEKWDGTGYPRSLAGDSIPLEARIMALADIYDALISERVYKKEWSHEEAVEEILSKNGTQLDPLVVKAFVAEQGTFNQISRQYRDV